LNPLKCKARDNNCSSCQRKGHFPKSRNCLKTRLKKFKQKNKCLKQNQGCQTLRNFLKCCKYKLTNELIPYDKLLKIDDFTRQKSTLLEDNISDSKIYDLIKQRIISLENKIELEKRVAELCLLDTVFMQTYLLMNLDVFLIGSQIENYENKHDSSMVIENYVEIEKNEKLQESEKGDIESILKNLEAKIKR
jgi:hypothetical protein